MIYKKYYITYMNKTGYGDATITTKIFNRFNTIKVRNRLENVTNPVITFVRFEGYTFNKEYKNEQRRINV
jgi:hypothetical protein